MGTAQSSGVGARAVLRLAWPLILSNSLWTLQVFIDRVMLGHSSSGSLAAGMGSAALFWPLLMLLQNTANYATTFVAQYTGARQPEKVGPIVWQALYFALGAGVASLGLIPLAQPLVSLVGHEAALQDLELAYFRWLSLSTTPTLVTAAVCSFFAGRGQSRTVLVVNAAGLAVNAMTAYVLIFGHLGLAPWGIAGAGLATVVGSTTSAILALALFFRTSYRAECCTAAGWRFDLELFRRLLRYGFPNGIFTALDTLAFALFLALVGRLGTVDLAATTITFTLNMVCILPVLGLGQAVEVLVGQRLGADEPDAAERATWMGLRLAAMFTAAVVVVYVLFPDQLADPFRSDNESATWELIRERVPKLLRFVSVYAMFDTVNLVVSFALRGAGDTRFVTRLALSLPWPTMVLPTWAVLEWGWGLYWAWAFATLYVLSMAGAFLVRFRQGKWRSMRIIAPQAAA
jgi:MATE family multidrug resistance protein